MDNEQRQWQEDIRRVRRTARSLAQPLEAVMNAMKAVERLSGLVEVQLPLMDFSPFAVLPDQPPATQKTSESQAHRSRQQSSSTTERTQQRSSVDTISPTSPRSRHPLESQPPTRQDRPPASPVFSLRRIKAPPGGATSAPKSAHPGEKPDRNAPSRRTGAVTERTLQANESRSIGSERSMPKTGSQQAVDHNSGRLVQGAQRRTRHDPVTGTAQLTHTAEFTCGEPDRPPLPFPEEVLREVTTMPLLATLVDELLATPSSSKGTETPNPVRPSRLQPSPVEQTRGRGTTPYFPEPEPDHRLPDIGSPGTPEPTPQTPPQHPSAPDEPLDAETLAELINDILIEQARRHGVDLS